MSDIRVTLFFCSHGAGLYDMLSDDTMVNLNAPDLTVIRIKHRSVEPSVDSTGWACGLMQQDPPE